MGYDLLDRLNSGSRTGTTIGYTYDANGNRLSQSGTSASTYTVSGASNRLSATTGALSRSYTHDAVGNTLSSGTTVHTYNHANRMKSGRLVGNSDTSYVYNALGQRVKKSGGVIGSAIYYLYDEAGHLVGEYDSSGNPIQETVWLGDIPIATLRPNGAGVDVFYVHTDQLHTPRKVTNPSNQLRWRWDPTPFGEGTPDQNPASLGTFVYNLRFPGQQFDVESNLNYNYFRDYDPAVGRYVQSDPIGLRGGLNTFAYVGGDPLSNSDSMGLFFDSTGRYTGVGRAGVASRFGYAGLAFAGGYGLGTAIYNSAGTGIQDALAKPYDPNDGDTPEKQADRRAYHRRCDEKAPPGLTGCDLLRWKIQKVKDCIRMRSDYMTRWNDTYKGHYDQINQKRRELQGLERELQAGCCGQ